MALSPRQLEILNSANSGQGTQSPSQSSGQSSRMSTQPVEKQKLRTAAQGLTFGFSDEIEAFVRSIGGGQGQTYEAIRDDIRNKLTAYKESNPAEAISIETVAAIAPTALSLLSGVGSAAGAGNIARLAGGAGRLAKAGTDVGIKATTLGGAVPRAAQGLTTGVGYGAAYGLGTAEGTVGEQLNQAKTSALMGGAFGVGGQALFSGLKGVAAPFSAMFRHSNTEADIANVVAKVNQIASDSFESLRKSKVKIDQGVFEDNFTNAIDEIIKNGGYDPLLPPASGGSQNFVHKAIKDIEGFFPSKQKIKTVDDFLIDEANDLLVKTNISNKLDFTTLLDVNGRLPRNLNGNITTGNQFFDAFVNNKKTRDDSLLKYKNYFDKIKEPPRLDVGSLVDLRKRLTQGYQQSYRDGALTQPAILRLRDAIDDIIAAPNSTAGGGLTEQWNKAQSLWKTKGNFQMITEELDKANRASAKSGIGTDKVSIYKAMANSILNNKRKTKFLNSEQIDSLRVIIQGGPIDNILQAVGRFAPTAGSTMRLMSAMGAFTSGGLTVPISMLATLSRSKANKSIQTKAKNLLEEFLQTDKQMIQEIGSAFNQLSSKAAPVNSRVSQPARFSAIAPQPVLNQQSSENKKQNNLTARQIQILNESRARGQL
jgi:hypothetical protein